MPLGMQSLTFQDLQKRLAGDNKGIDQIIEVLNQSNPIMQDLRFMEGNLPTGNKTTLRTAVPHPSIRMINRGVKATKSDTRQITDTCAMFEDRSEIDVKLLALSADPVAFRESEDRAHIEGFGQSVAEMMFYGDTDANPSEFNGLSVRYAKLSDEQGQAGYQIIDGGGTGSENTSIWIVTHGDDGLLGIYPRGTKAGLDKQDLGEQDAVDDNGAKYRVVSTLFSWDVGLAVKNIRKIAAVRNIAKAGLATKKADERKALVENILRAKGRIRGIGTGTVKPVMYCSPEVKTALEIFLTDNNNIHITRQEVMGEMPKLYVAGIEVKECDAITHAEAQIV